MIVQQTVGGKPSTGRRDQGRRPPDGLVNINWGISRRGIPIQLSLPLQRDSYLQGPIREPLTSGSTNWFEREAWSSMNKHEKAEEGAEQWNITK